MRKSLLLLSIFVFVFITGYSQTSYQVITYAGNTSGNAGFMNKKDTNARFNGPTAIAVDTAGNIYVADTYNNAIREILVTNDSVITLAGDTAGYSEGPDSTVGYVNGLGSVARFNYPLGICVDKGGNFVYVADTYNNVIRKISVVKGNVAKDSVSTIAGNDTLGYVNGTFNHAEFNRPVGVALDKSGNLFVTDEGNNVIREVATASTGSVSTFAGPQPNDTTIISGYLNGRADTAEFLGLYGITFDTANTMYVTEYKNNSVRMIKNGMVSTIAGFDTITFILPPDSLGDTLRYVTPSGYVNGPDNGVEFNNPTGIAVDDSGNIYVADEFNYII
ncbi:MAG TPA: hypothetical protein VK806_03675, partial [Bacteroidia bacterium]|nr:hypothetical protein [Bacteroidia bacterium]